MAKQYPTPCNLMWVVLVRHNVLGERRWREVVGQSGATALVASVPSPWAHEEPQGAAACGLTRQVAWKLGPFRPSVPRRAPLHHSAVGRVRLTPHCTSRGAAPAGPQRVPTITALLKPLPCAATRTLRKLLSASAAIK